MHDPQHDDAVPDAVPDALAQIAALLRIEVAVDQLTRPETHQLDRDHAAARRQLDELNRAHVLHIRVLRARYRDAHDRGHADGADRALCGMRYVGEQHRRRRARLAAGLTPTTAQLPPLLDQLQAAIANSGDTGRSPGGPAAHRSPVGLAALAIVTDMQRHVGARRREHLHDGLVTWARCPDRTADDAELAEHWVEHARAVLQPNPTGTRGLRGRCPACGRSAVSVPDDTGELVHRNALQVDHTTAVHCLGCGDYTPPWRAHLLAEVLEQQTDDARRSGSVNRPA